MVNPCRFYTYAYLREDRTPYYIGKGEGRRAYKKKRGEINLPTDKDRIILLKQNLTEEDALKHEIYMIAVFGRKDLGTGILRNRTNGGEGSSGAVKSEETIRKMSEANKGRIQSEETRRKRSEALKGENHPFYGKFHSEESKIKMREAKKGVILTEETKRKLSEVMKGKKWWNDGCGNTKLSKECPGDGWYKGRKIIYNPSLMRPI